MYSPETLKLISPTLKSRPLIGVTVLIVKDSRFVCEVARLLYLHSGARLRCVATITSARLHLRLYRPNVVLVDLGLPNGS